ncbi:MAG: GH116 family glycosyl hydrolase [Brevinematales bacterium]|nr:GH116 family glycosyl hydrolase [Brevinematales bacterium]
MKKSFFFLVFLGMVGSMMGLPSLEEFYEKTKIVVPAGERAQYVYGDNVAGYYENATHSYRQGQGYLFKNRNLFGDVTALRGGGILNKTKEATASEILLYGVRTLYKDGTREELALFSRQLGLGIEVSHPQGDVLGALLLFNEPSQVQVTNEKNILLITRSEKASDIPGYVAVGVDVSYTWERFSSEETWLKQKASFLTLKIISAQPVKTMHVYVAFGFTREEAIRKVSLWVGQNFYAKNKEEVYARHTRSFLWTDDDLFNQAVAWSIAGSYLFLVEEFGKGIWAGLPWFRDNWGRDTFIALPGTLLVSGHFDDAKGVITNFSMYQNRGIPYIEVSDTGDKAKEIKTRLGQLFGKDAVVKNEKVSLTLDNQWLERASEVEKRLATLRQEFPQVRVSYAVLTNKEFGRVPNRVAAGGSIIYNTTDGTPWLIREVYEYLSYTKDKEFVKAIYPTVVIALNGALQNYVDSQGFLTHGDQDTWMDASRGPGKEWSPRGNRAVEIQALWASALQVGVQLAKMQNDNENAARWQAVYDNLRTNFVRVFWNEYHKNIADRVLADGTQDMRLRPNALMLISIPLFDPLLPLDKEALMVKKTISELLFPYGIASLSPKDVFFHPYHDNQPNYHKDAAYHNGTVWGWNAGFTITALVKHGYTELAYALTTNLSFQIVSMGCRGNMSELIDALPGPDGRIKLSGTYAQAWSISEFARNAFQDYLGVRPMLLEDAVLFEPHIPSRWNAFQSRIALGEGSMDIRFQREGKASLYMIKMKGLSSVVCRFVHNDRGRRLLYEIPLRAEEEVVIRVSGERVILGEKELTPMRELNPSLQGIIGELRFAEPKLYPQVRAHKEKDYLKTIIDKKEYSKYLPKTKGGLFGW